jgi:hypothetical protein
MWCVGSGATGFGLVRFQGAGEPRGPSSLAGLARSYDVILRIRAGAGGSNRFSSGVTLKQVRSPAEPRPVSGLAARLAEAENAECGDG